MCMHVSQAWHVCARAYSYQKLSVLLHLFAFTEGRECICIPWCELRAERVYACCCLYQVLSSTCASRGVCWHVSRAERAPSFSFLCRELSVCVHVPSSVRMFRELIMHLHSHGLPISWAESVPPLYKPVRFSFLRGLQNPLRFVEEEKKKNTHVLMCVCIHI